MSWLDDNKCTKCKAKGWGTTSLVEKDKGTGIERTYWVCQSCGYTFLWSEYGMFPSLVRFIESEPPECSVHTKALPMEVKDE